ncbi:MAG: hypothetical protein ACQEXQ_18240 [Bacillota bacterium]
MHQRKGFSFATRSFGIERKWKDATPEERYEARLAESKPILDQNPGPRPSGFQWNPERTELEISFEGINGRLVPARQIFGFKVEADGQNQALFGKLTEDGRRVVLSFERPVPAGANLFHGSGRNPLVNVRDSNGIPLPVFGPVVSV